MQATKALRRIVRAIWRQTVPDNRASADFRLAAEKLRPGDIAVDCGANVGIYTAVMARSGATVHAFEPDPVAFSALQRKFALTKNVTLHKAAASNRNGRAKLYFHSDRESDPLALSQSSSLDALKTNVDKDCYSEVELVDFAAFIDRVGAIKLLKMDVEGHEIEIINHLFDHNRVSAISQAFVELHDRKNPELKSVTDALRQRIALAKLPFDLTWH
jgi:FkbM family methyltransferase